ncbi:MAG TPA: Uma2 family endonuclease [Polyangia bacterium]|nr:Uma2 family endonuclease [Polyangia bacterium]
MSLAGDLASLDRDDEPAVDHFVHLRATWSDYARLRRMRGDGSVPRLAYNRGVLEIMSPSQEHELITSWIGRLVEAWCEERDVEISALRSWTLKRKKDETGVEPDECYVLGPTSKKSRPDLAIEVIWTSGGIDKRVLYHRFKVRELWFWRRGRIRVFAYRARGYEEVATSEALHGIDLPQLASFLDRPTMTKAVRAYRAALRSKPRR